MNIFFIGFALLMGCWNFFSPPVAHGFGHYKYIGWFLITGVRFIGYRKYIYKMLTGKPILSVNEIYINDLLKKIKYDWNDIQEVYEDNAYLYIILYQPENYIKYIKNPLRRFWAKGKIKSGKKTPFRINIDMVDSEPNALLQLLDYYSAGLKIEG